MWIPRKLVFSLVVTLLLLPSGTGAQTAASGKPTKPPPRTVRVLAVGESPPFRQEIRDGVAYELEPPRDSLPPYDICTRPVPAGPEGQVAEPVAAGGMPMPHSQLRLGRVSGPLLIPPGAGPLDILRFENGAPGEAWLRLTRPELGNLLVLSWRAPGQADWKSPSALVLTDDAASFPAGTVRIINLFPQAVQIALGQETATLAHRAVLLKQVKVSARGDSSVFRVLVPDQAGKLRRYYSGAVTQQPGQRGLIVIYRADGVAPRRPLAVANIREPMPGTGPPVQPPPQP